MELKCVMRSNRGLFAKSLVAFRLSPKKRTFPSILRSSGTFALLSVKITLNDN